METIALFGGSFDPPHIGHEAVVREALKLKYVEKVVIMPTYQNPFKSSFYAPSTLRLKWLKMIFGSFKDVEISNYEVNLNTKVSSIDSVKYLLKSYKKIYLIIGADNLKSLTKWDRYDELKTLVTFVVAHRDDIEIPENFLELKVEESISSTELREHIEIKKLSKICSKEIVKFYKEKNDK